MQRELVLLRLVYDFCPALQCGDEVAFYAAAYLDALKQYSDTTAALAFLLAWRFHCDRGLCENQDWVLARLGLAHARGLLGMMRRLRFDLRPRTAYELAVERFADDPRLGVILAELKFLLSRPEWAGAPPETLVAVAQVY